MQEITVQVILSQYRTRFDSLEIELIIAHALGQSREFVLTYPTQTLTPTQYREIQTLLKRRIGHEPLAYILGHREFFGLDFTVTKDTLIPRPETELMVEAILKDVFHYTAPQENHCIIDIGTGSGCIIVSLAHEISKNKSDDARYTFFGVDISSQALIIAKDNACKHTLEKKITFMESDLLENIAARLLEQPNSTLTIAANLPYLSHTIYKSSMPDVQNFEPQSALLSEEDGLQHYRKLLEQIHTLHVHKIFARIKLFFEISPEQKTAIEKLICIYFPQASVETRRDLSGTWRLTIANI